MEAAGKGGKAARKKEAKKERSTGHNPEKCPVCMTVFDDTVQRPRTLPCGHTVCTLCANKPKQQGHVTCPKCRVSHAVPKGRPFPEVFTRRKKDGEAAAAASPPPSAGTRKGAAEAAGQKEAPGLLRKMRSFPPLPQSEADSTIEDRQQAILTPSLKAEDLRSPTQHVMRLLEAGHVFGVHQVEGRRRLSRISLKAGRLYLHTLKEGPLPPGATTIQLCQVVPPSLPCIVFLDISWPGIASRRVHVRLSPDTPWGRQAVLLCTGQHGPSYAGTRLFEVWNKGLPGECVRGGDYERNDGSGGAALLPDLHEVEYRVSGEAGAVCGWRGDPAQGAVFAITTRDRQHGDVYGHVFGEVVRGLDTVVAAAHHTPITEVTINNCGVVLWG